ncbi:MAG: hypothetical protein LBU23_05355, partial [Planctomycetota bacterium]|nr:hypothetical protein [Planctomycetota bacterium]
MKPAQRQVFSLLIAAAPFLFGAALAVEAGFPDSAQADLLPGFEKYLAKHPLLREGGGILLSEPDGEWLVLGVGAAVRRREDQSEYELWKVADYHALAALTEALEGVRYSGTDAIAGSTASGRNSGGTLSIAR